jgi:hypothetical protein
MRRLLTFLTAIVLCWLRSRSACSGRPAVLAPCVAVAAAADAALPTRAPIGSDAPACALPAHPASGDRRAAAIREPRRRARRLARLVSHAPGNLVLTRYFGADDEQACCPPGWWRGRIAHGRWAWRSATGGSVRSTRPWPVPARVGRRAARPHHPAAAARGTSGLGNGRRHPRPAAPLALGRLARLPAFATARACACC